MSRVAISQRLARWMSLVVSPFLISAAAQGQITASTSNVNFNVQVGSSQILPVTITNTYKANATISQATVSGTGFSFVGPNLPITVAPQQCVVLSVSFAPPVAGNLSGTLTVSASASWGGHNTSHSNSVTVALSGNGLTSGYLAAPASMNAGSVAVGSSQTQALTISNSGGSSLTISGATVSGSGFSASGLAFPYTLPAGGSASLSVTFAPSASGTSNATLSLASNASDPSVGVSLTGSGTSLSGTLGVTPGSISFGSVTVGTTQTQSGSLTASGGGVTLSSASSTNSAFTVGGITLPVTLAAGQSVPFTVTFSPTTTGAATANLSFFTSTSTSALESVTGTGATVQHTVDLSWNASTSTSISGYNVYRASVSGGPYSRMNPSLIPSMNYSDGSVQSGQTYYYVTTAVDSSGVESSYSSEAQAVIPFP